MEMPGLAQAFFVACTALAKNMKFTADKLWNV
jgi:hypothetical protein